MLRRIAGVCGVISQLIGLSFLSAAALMSPWFSWRQNYLSLLGAEGSATMLFNSGLILTGFFSLIFALGLGKALLLGQRLGRLGIMSLALGSVALSLMGIFPRTSGIPHNSASLAFFTFISLAIFLIGIKEITTSQRIWGALSLAAAVLMVTLQLIPSPWNGGAIMQLLSCLPWSLWTIAYAIRLFNAKPVEV